MVGNSAVKWLKEENKKKTKKNIYAKYQKV